MILRGIDFGYVMNASGARNFFGEGYWFHKYGCRFGLNYTGSTFVAKTTTLDPRVGNMPLTTDLQPTELLPECIKINFLKAAVLNAVGLSGPGAKDLFERKIWQARTEPFFISFAAVADTASERIEQWKKFVTLARSYLPAFSAPVGLEMNPFCPNTGIEENPSIEEILIMLDVASGLGIPLVVKINALMPIELVLRIQQHPACDAICVSNTIPFGRLPIQINWEYLWGNDVRSPLYKFGGGGLSGAPIFWLMVEWIQNARKSGLHKPIIGCGGIMCWRDARIMLNAGANAVQVGSVSITRPLRVQSIIRDANAYAVQRK